MQLANELEKERNLITLKTNAAFAHGQAMAKRTPLEIAQAKKKLQSKEEVSAFEAGISGIAREDYIAERDAEIELRHALITSLDPDSDTFMSALVDIYELLGHPVPEKLAEATEKQEGVSEATEPGVSPIFTKRPTVVTH